MTTHQVRTACPMDCPDTCALDVEVVDGRVTRIGAAEHLVTGGFVCSKIARFADRVYHPTRLRYPMRRTGPKGAGADTFARISWDEALGEIADRFRSISRDVGAEAILPYHYGGSNGLLTEGFLDDYFFARLGASRLAKTICAAPSTTAAMGLYGKMPGVAYEDYPAAQCIVLWGVNPKASSIHLVPFLKEARRNGATVVVIDPRRNFSSREIDVHLPVRPGTDLPLALAMIEWWRSHDCLDDAFMAEHVEGAAGILERAADWPLQRAAGVSGVAAERIETVARVYAEASPAVIRCGWGLERNRNGGHAVAAVLAIPALLGKFGRRGGGYTMSNSGATRADMRAVLGPLDWNTRVINMTRLGAVLNGAVEPAIAALFVYNSNPAVTVPDQRDVLRGLAREDLFTVVFDQVHTDTADFADILLPATTFLEHDDLRVGYGNYVLGSVRPVIDAEGEARSNADVFAALGRAMGWTDDAFGWDGSERFRRVAEAITSPRGAPGAHALRAGGVLPQFDESPIQFGSVFPRTADRRVHLAPPELGADPYRYQDLESAHPLSLITPASSRLISSTCGEYNAVPVEIVMHPSDAGPRQIQQGDPVRVFNDLAEVHCRARLSDSVRPGVVSMPKGAWRAWTANRETPTALCPATISDVGGGACFNDARVDVARR